MKEQTLTEEQWDIVREVNSYWNYKIKYVGDQDNYGKPDVWCFPIAKGDFFSGDCEDYAIAKQKTLKDNHDIESWLATCTVPAQGYHAVLIIHTDRGAYVLDNRYRTVYHYKSCNYKWDKIETEGGVWYEFS